MTRFLALLYALIFVFAVCSSKPHGSMDADSTDFVTASILHIGPGKDIYSACGHAALRMQCPSHGLDICFGYLVPDGPMLVANTVYGSPKQGLVRIPTSTYLPEIFNEGRAVDQYELNLTDKEKRRLWQILDEECERGAYLDYDYINQGCALSLVGKIKEALIDDTLSINCREQDPVSCRTVVSRNLSQRPWTAFWMSFMLGEKTNAKRDPDCELMIPSDLIASLQTNFIKAHDGTTRPILIDAEHLAVTHGDKSGGITPLMIALVMLCCCIVISTFRVQKLRSRFAKAVGVGEADIIADAIGSFGKVTDTCHVTVKPVEDNGISDLLIDSLESPADIYTLQGILVRRHTTDLGGLPSGFYIINGQTRYVK